VDFFKSQDQAKRNTSRLIILFGLAVISLILITNFLIMVIFGFVGTEMTSMAAVNAPRMNWEMFLYVGLGVSAVILFGSLYKIATLSGGGARVAEMMDGKLLLSGTGDIREQRLLNVVEEMAIASGTPVPPVYVMEEAGINAFAAGYSPSDAVIGVTRGAINTLGREQLQGVIAHEFSHILHGDMRINIRLIGVLHGILILGIIGYHLMRSGSYSRRSKDSGGIVILGLGLLVVGYTGTFFGNLIKAAVSRQREYLADASAVQYTRNPNGIAGALMQIATHHERSFLNHPGGNEISHALFEEAQAHSLLGGLYATHPPLEDRIAAILPNWDGKYDVAAVIPEGEQLADAAGSESRSDRDRQRAAATLTAGAILGEQLVQAAGNPGLDHLSVAEKIIARIPPAWIAASRDPSGARAVVYLLVLQESDPVRRRQLNLLEHSADSGVFAEVSRLLASGQSVSAEQRLPLVEICLASLRQLSAAQYRLFRQNFDEMIRIDNKINLLEWSLHKLVLHHLDAVFSKRQPARLGRRDLARCRQSVSVLLSVIAQSTTRDAEQAQQWFQAGAASLDTALDFIPVAGLNVERLGAAIDELAEVRPLQKPALLKACAAAIRADGEVQPIEVELLRAVSASIDCPMPPLLAS
jgi:Zn-dependent protease with chaperone function